MRLCRHGHGQRKNDGLRGILCLCIAEGIDEKNAAAAASNFLNKTGTQAPAKRQLLRRWTHHKKLAGHERRRRGLPAPAGKRMNGKQHRGGGMQGADLHRQRRHGRVDAFNQSGGRYRDICSNNTIDVQTAQARPSSNGGREQRDGGHVSACSVPAAAGGDRSL